VAFQVAHLLRIVELLCESTGTVTLKIYSDLPGDQVALRETKTINLSAVTGRRTARFRLAGTTKGKIFRFEITSDGVVRLYGARVYSKPVGFGSDWEWSALPVEETPDEWTVVRLPIAESEEDWTAVPVPIDPTSEEWSNVPVPIDPTSEEWTNVPVPIDPTSEEWTNVPVPIVDTEEDWSAIPLPIDPTPDEWAAVKLPIPDTPDEQIWKEIPIAL
jgi:hypothetical protein